MKTLPIPTTRVATRRIVEQWYRSGKSRDDGLSDEWLACLPDDLMDYAIEVYGALVFEQGQMAGIFPDTGNSDNERDHVWDAVADQAFDEVHAKEFWG